MFEQDASHCQVNLRQGRTSPRCFGERRKREVWPPLLKILAPERLRHSRRRRMQATQLLVCPLRLGEVGASEPVDGLWIDGLRGREVTPRGDDARVVPGALLGIGQRAPRDWLVGQEGRRALQVVHGLDRPVEREQRGAGEEPGRPEGRIEPRRRTELDERLGVASLLRSTMPRLWWTKARFSPAAAQREMPPRPRRAARP